MLSVSAFFIVVGLVRLLTSEEIMENVGQMGWLDQSLSLRRVGATFSVDLQMFSPSWTMTRTCLGRVVRRFAFVE